MGDDPDVNDAYALSSTDDIKALYRAWSHSYDAAFHEGQGYQLPRDVATTFLSAGGRGPVLDVGAGTGLVGEYLKAGGIDLIDGIDLSDEMLKVAAMKGHYRELVACDVMHPLALLDAPYAGIVSAGTFTLGHVGPTALHNLLDVAAADACFVISVNAAHFEAAGFANLLDELGDAVNSISLRDVRIYDDRADEEHRDDMARLVTFRKT